MREEELPLSGIGQIYNIKPGLIGLIPGCR